MSRPDLLSSATVNLNSVVVRDKLLRLVQYGSKIEKFSSAENQKILRAISSNLGASRRAFRLWKWLEGIDTLRKINSDDHLVRTLGYFRHTFLSTYYLFDNLVWCGERGIWKPADFDRFKKLTYTVWAIAIFANILLTIRSYQVVIQSILSTGAARKKIVQRRKDGENVDKEMAEITQKMGQLDTKKGDLVQSLIRDVLDFTIPYNLARGGGVVNDNVIGFIGVVTSIMGLFAVWK
eukprot:c13456_g1_i1.p1 GENE.c13456_g1_i1~~c13456_g1_i1.p1  ORF type:complete len:258 (-),score=76.05 c13456_g1_i1:33-740(-)